MTPQPPNRRTVSDYLTIKNSAGQREWLKAGPLQGIYAPLRRVKRWIRREPLAGVVLLEGSPLPAAELRAAVRRQPDYARLYYSLGLAYLDAPTAADAQRAQACLRSAATLGFESPERVALYLGEVAARSGRLDEARALVEPLSHYELTQKESELRERLLNGQVASPASPAGPAGRAPAGPRSGSGDSGPVAPLRWREVGAILEAAPVASLLVVDDHLATSSGWCPGARYLLTAEDVTGLSPAAVPALGLEFDAAAGPAMGLTAARAAGVRCRRWIVVEEGASAVP